MPKVIDTQGDMKIMGNYDITDDQVKAFEQDGAVTIDTPLTSQQIAEASQLMDRMLPLGPPRPGEKNPRYRVGKNNVCEPAFVRIMDCLLYTSPSPRDRG